MADDRQLSQQVNSSVKQMVDEPRFWLKKKSCDEEFPFGL